MSDDNRYDRIPYKSHPFPQSHPDRLGTIATLAGMSPAALDGCRVLELGCASGGNLIPVAEQFPGAAFLGIDASQRQIEEGQAAIRELGLRNIELRQQDIRAFEAEREPFDYILSHGVYSWVPDDVQAKLLEICQRHLAPQGVAYLSYNTYPGWHLRGMIREIMRYRARSFDTPASQLAQARGLLAFLSNSVSTEGNAYGLLLKQELESISRSEDYYLQHEQLEEINAPIYFHQFAERAAAAGLQYLGEADFGATSLDNFAPQVRAMLHSVSGDLIETEQYMDFLRNRSFRQTLLCRAELKLDRGGSPQQLLKLRVASNSTPEAPLGDLRSAEKAAFRRRNSTLNTTAPVVKAALHHLSAIWPRSVPFIELASIARSAVSDQPAMVHADVLGPASRQLAETLLRCYATGHVDLHLADSGAVCDVSERPRATALARRQAAKSAIVTNRLHETVSLDDVQRQLLMLLDGTRDREQLSDLLAERISRGELIVYENNRRIVDLNEARRVAAQHLGETLQALARLALLIPT